MCGIVGIVDTQDLGDRGALALRGMCEIITHRGPDDEGHYFSQHAALGIRRLSIIDLQTGHQPILNEDKTIAVVLNGELYNYRQLRSDLEAKGHKFTTRGDTETIVHGYEEYGEGIVRRLRGMFCFALWDDKQQKLLLARDRVGIKQVYFTEVTGKFLFGSEIKCILTHPDSVRRINSAALASYLTFLYITAPNTIYEGIHELLPGSFLVWEKGQARVERYWKLEFREEKRHSESYYVEGLAAKLADAVESHLVSDVPLGAFLSGGIDSGIVVALMSHATQSPVETFTVGFEGAYAFCDERNEARLVADRYRTNHHEFLVRPNVAEILPDIVHYLDQPLADSSAVPNYYICELARSKVTVALSGMGGDEMAGGYERYLGILLGDRFRSLPKIFRKALSRGAARLPDWGGKGRVSAARLKRFARSLELDFPRAYLSLLSTFDGQELQDLLVGESLAELKHFAPQEWVAAAFHKSGSAHPVDQMLNADVTGYLPGDLLPLTDRMSMAHSLEVRVPLLDHELLEFAATIPANLKIRGLTKKFILKKVGAKFLPEATLRGRKRGFSIPLDFWFRDELRSYVQEILAPARIEGLGCFNPPKIQSLLDDHFCGRANNENKIWALLVFVLWHDHYMTGMGWRRSAQKAVPVDESAANRGSVPVRAPGARNSRSGRQY
jgi:asparagine synthase (glutamine-hydrolysing)